MRSVTLFPALATVLVISTTANSASFDLGLTGTITPAACVPSVGSPTIALGTVPAEMLSAETETLLPLKNITFSIVCDAPVKVGLKASDNRGGTQFTPARDFTVYDSQTFNPASNYTAFGLGTDAKGNKIGLWIAALDASSLSTDTESSVDVLYSNNAGGTWWKNARVYQQLYNATGVAADSIKGFAKAGEVTPMAFTTLSGSIAVQMVIAPASTLDLSQPVSLNGSATIELVYL